VIFRTRRGRVAGCPVPYAVRRVTPVTVQLEQQPPDKDQFTGKREYD
jgi:hypothetical protein